MISKVFRTNGNKVIKNKSSDRANKIVKNLFKFKMSNNKKFKILIFVNIRITKKLIFLITSTKESLITLSQYLLKLQIFDVLI